MNSKNSWVYLTVVSLSLILFLWLVTVSISFSEKKTFDETAIEGKKVWQENNCVECHSLLSNGGYNAVELTNITSKHSKEYLTNYLQKLNPQAEKIGHPSLTSEQAEKVVKYLDSVKNVPEKDWPPKPLKLDTE